MTVATAVIEEQTSAGAVLHFPPHRLCTTCNESIPTKRLIAKPRATQCVSCLETAGDVPKLKRFDETMPNGDVVEGVMYTHNAYIDEQIMRITGVRTIPEINDEGVIIENDTSVIAAQPMQQFYADADEAESQYRSQRRSARFSPQATQVDASTQ